MLPSLPRILNKREASWTTTVFRKWLEQKGMTGVFEIKYSTGESLPFDAVKDHQVWNLLKVRHQTFVYKIPDLGEKAPFDMFSMKEMPAYVVIKYPKGVAIIPIDIWCSESSRSKRRSLTWERAKELSTVEFDSKIRKE